MLEFPSNGTGSLCDPCGANALMESQMEPLVRPIDGYSDDFSKNIFNNRYPNLSSLIVPRDFGYDNTYELPLATYYFVLTPFNKSYLKLDYKHDLQNIEKIMRKRYSYERIFITREIMNCAKVHYNVCITCKNDLTTVKAGTFIRGKYSICKPRDVSKRQDMETVCKYMIKESKRRPMRDGLDRFIFKKLVKRNLNLDHISQGWLI